MAHAAQIQQWEASRDDEEALFDRCREAVQAQSPAQDQREANVFRLAGMVLDSKLPSEAAALTDSAEAYFAHHPGDLLSVEGVLARRWIVGLPRLRDMLAAHLTLYP